ncbi:hypothetical protein DP033_13855 [Escherichia coli]|nr:hypothetical protein [Escherichia coli]PSZ16743.1 hypothetical protein C7B04_12905 [Escherichia sp. 4726-5]
MVGKRRPWSKANHRFTRETENESSSFCTGARRQKVLLIKRSETFAQNNTECVDLSFNDKNEPYFP